MEDSFLSRVRSGHGLHQHGIQPSERATLLELRYKVALSNVATMERFLAAQLAARHAAEVEAERQRQMAEAEEQRLREEVMGKRVQEEEELRRKVEAQQDRDEATETLPEPSS